MSQEQEALREALCRPFPMSQVKARPGPVFDGRDGPTTVVYFYLTKEAVEERLDEVFGPGGWQTKITPLFDKKSVVIELSFYVEGRGWVTRSDIGGESGQPGEGDRQKAAYTYAIRRVGAQLGIGRYLANAKGIYWPVEVRGGDKKNATFPRNNQPVLPDHLRLPEERKKAPHATNTTNVRPANSAVHRETVVVPPPNPAPPANPAPAGLSDEQKLKRSAEWKSWLTRSLENAQDEHDIAQVKARINDPVRSIMTREDLDAVIAAGQAARQRLGLSTAATTSVAVP